MSGRLNHVPITVLCEKHIYVYESVCAEKEILGQKCQSLFSGIFPQICVKFKQDDCVIYSSVCPPPVTAHDYLGNGKPEIVDLSNPTQLLDRLNLLKQTRISNSAANPTR